MSLTCQQEAVIDVAAGFGFAKLVWLAPVNGNNGLGGTGVASALANVASADAHQTNVGLTGVPGVGSSIQSDGTLVYSGPDLACNIHVDLVTMTPHSAFANILNFNVNVFQDGNNISSVNVTMNSFPGPYDFPFTIPGAVNSLITVEVDASWSGGNAFANLEVNATTTLTPA